MKQLKIFDSSKLSDSSSSTHYWKMCIDGASRNNPGPAGIGIVIYRDNETIKKYGFFVGSKTNNQAEYLALLVGLIVVLRLLATKDLLSISSDSELLVKQIKGLYRVKNPDLKELYVVAKALLSHVQYDIGHVLRHKNTEADALANQGIDQGNRIPDDIVKVLHDYGITL